MVELTNRIVELIISYKISNAIGNIIFHCAKCLRTNRSFDYVRSVSLSLVLEYIEDFDIFRYGKVNTFRFSEMINDVMDSIISKMGCYTEDELKKCEPMEAQVVISIISSCWIAKCLSFLDFKKSKNASSILFKCFIEIYQF